MKKIFNAWKATAGKIGNFQSRIMLSVVFYVLVLPYGLIVKMFLDPLRIKKTSNTNWLPRSQMEDTLKSIGRQF